MNVKKGEEWLKQVEDAARRELSPEELEGVTGGVVTPEGEAKLRSGLKLAKLLNMSLEEVLEMVPQYYEQLHPMFPETTMEEAVDLIKEIWDSI